MGERSGAGMRRAACIVFAVLAYMLALSLPAARRDGSPIMGYEALRWCVMAPYTLSWSGNSFGLASVMALLYGKLVTSAVLSILALTLGSTVIFVLDQGTFVSSGFYLWEGSFAILTFGAIAEMLILRRIPPE